MQRRVILLGLSLTVALEACVTPIVDPAPKISMGSNGWEAPDADSFSWPSGVGSYAHRRKLDFHKINPPGTDLNCQVAGGPWRGGDLARSDADRLIAVVRQYDASSAILWVGGWQGIAIVGTACGRAVGGGDYFYFARVQGAWILKKRIPVGIS